MEKIKKKIKEFYIYYLLRNLMTQYKQKSDLKKWEKMGRPSPPPHIVKQKTIIEFAKRYDLRIFVETGTYFGDMVYAMKDVFDKIYSVELGDFFYKNAVKRFKKYKNVNLIHGDSSKTISNIVNILNEPALFWLDGHYSGGDTAIGMKAVPIIEELDAILSSKFKHVVIIDDARCFGEESGYPKKEDLFAFIKDKNDSITIMTEGGYDCFILIQE